MFKDPAKTEGEQNKKVGNITRRDFLNTAGAAAAGGLVVAAGASLFNTNAAKANTPEAASPLPWKYTKLDPMEAGQRGYKNYLAKGG